ncbi:MAG TPA: IS481 family transposase [Mycobacterium sp.]|nr:IS481 family transposase [Mycobacterium sp.]
MLVEISVVEQRYQAVLAVLNGVAVTEVASRFDVSRQTVHRWLARYERAGLAGLADRSHRPLECPHQMPAQVEMQILEWRRKHTTWGPRRLVHEAARIGLVTSRSAVYRCLVRHHLIEEHPRRGRAEKWKRWERGRPMELWQFDLVGGICLDDGTELKALTGVDDHSRFCVSAALLRRATSRPVCEAFAAAMRAYGVPEEVLTDNGRQFTGRFHAKDVEVLFDRICRENGITHRLTAPYSPTTTGKIERFHRALRTEFLRGRTFASLATAQAEIDAWVADYNENRPHQGIGMATPAQRFRGTSTAITVPDQRLAVEDRDSDDWVSRRVAANGIISVAYQQISVGKHRAGAVVDVHLDGALLQVWHRNELLKTIMRTDQKEVRKKRAARAR